MANIGSHLYVQTTVIRTVYGNRSRSRSRISVNTKGHSYAVVVAVNYFTTFYLVIKIIHS